MWRSETRCTPRWESGEDVVTFANVQPRIRRRHATAPAGNSPDLLTIPHSLSQARWRVVVRAGFMRLLQGTTIALLLVKDEVSDAR
jgi:hypothetical protein